MTESEIASRLRAALDTLLSGRTDQARRALESLLNELEVDKVLPRH